MPNRTPHSAAGLVPRSHCPIAFSLDIVGDKWTLLVLRDLIFAGKARFRELAASPEGIASNILADRLKRLEAHGLISRAPDADDARQAIYRPTPNGLDLLPMLLEMIRWGAAHDAQTAVPEAFVARIARDRAALIAELRARFDEPA